MEGHNRSRSRGAFSILSIDTFRSISRAGSRQATRADADIGSNDTIHSPSSLSHCDPKCQPPASAELLPPTATQHCGGPVIARQDTKRRRRPLSWLSFNKSRRLYSSSTSVQLPKDSSASTVARSVISAPILTSTTNAKVAASVEGVHCGELSQADFDKSKWSSKVGCRLQADATKRVGTEDSQKRPRFAAWRDRLFKRQVVVSETAEDEVTASISRRGTETLNLCGGKIKELTGSGNVMRKLVGDKQADIDGYEDPLLLHKQGSNVNFVDLEGDQRDNGSHVGSLSRSFNSALEKLHTKDGKMSSLRSKSSMLSNGEEYVQELPSPVMGTLGAAPTRTPTAKTLQFCPGKGGYIPAPAKPAYPGGVEILAMHSSSDTFAKAPAGITLPEPASPYPEQLLQSGEYNGKQPLRGQLGNEGQGLLSNEDDQLDDAPIYSPSLGDLSQYARTPETKSTKDLVITPVKADTMDTVTVNTLKKSKSGLGSLLSRGSPLPLKGQDENKSFEASQVKKSRSMDLLNSLVKADSPTSSIANISSTNVSAFTPATPSPLRNEAHLRHPSPRSPEDKFKRFGVVGMPSSKTKLDQRLF